MAKDRKKKMSKWGTILLATGIKLCTSGCLNGGLSGLVRL